MKGGGVLLKFGSSFVFNGYYHDFVTFAARGFESEQREAAVAGNESVTH